MFCRSKGRLVVEEEEEVEARDLLCLEDSEVCEDDAEFSLC